MTDIQKLKKLVDSMLEPVDTEDLVVSGSQAEPAVTYVGDPQADSPKPRRDDIKKYGRKFQR